MNKVFKRITAITLVLVTVLVLFPSKASAASNTYYMFVGEQGTMSITANQVPNAKWKTSNSSVLRIVKQSKSSVTTEGMKAGAAKLTVYNSKNTKQKYTYIIKVLKENKLTKKDFVFKWKTEGTYLDVLDEFSRVKNMNAAIFDSDNFDRCETYRGINYRDSYKTVCARYGKKSLKAVSSNDPYYNNYYHSNFRYYVTYNYNSTYKIRMYFDLKQQLVGLVCGKNVF